MSFALASIYMYLSFSLSFSVYIHFYSPYFDRSSTLQTLKLLQNFYLRSNWVFPMNIHIHSWQIENFKLYTLKRLKNFYLRTNWNFPINLHTLMRNWKLYHNKNSLSSHCIIYWHISYTFPDKKKKFKFIATQKLR